MIGPVIRYVTCKRCKQRFEAARADALYCSPACRQAAHRVRVDAQRRRLKERTAARRAREVKLRVIRAETEAAARENIRRFESGEMTPEVIEDLRRKEKVANLAEWIKSCDKAIERGRRAAVAKADFEAELAAIRGEA